MQIEHKEHQNLIKTIAKNHDINSYDYEIGPGSETGDGYIAKILRVNVKTDKKHLNIVLKIVSENANYQDTKDMFDKEICVYENILPAFERFQKENGLVSNFEGYPKCFGTCTVEMREAIAMENLVGNGYQLWNRKTPMDHHHLALVMKEFGKFHAVSMAIRHKDPKLFDEFKQVLNKPLTEEQTQEMKLFLESILSGLTKALQGYKKLEKGLKTLADNSEKFWLKELLAEDNQLVVTHGDSWCNNIFFKYENPKTKMPSKVCLIDWQLTTVGSPIADIAYFFGTNSSKDTLYDYETYLKIYYDSLSETLKNVACDPEEIYPYGLLQEHWRKISKIAIYLSPIVFPVLLIDEEEVSIVDDATDGADYIKKLSSTRAAEECDERTRDLVEFMIDNNFI